MKRILCFAWLLSAIPALAQNLAPNPSFEDYDECPTYMPALSAPLDPPVSITDWYMPTMGSSDYFNTCSFGGSGFSIPGNFVGWQEPRTGNGYLGIHCNYPSEEGYWEYVEAPLLSTLTAGHRYYIGYWVNLAAWNQSFAIAGIDQMGALFRSDYIDLPSFSGRLTETPQVISPAGYVYKDTAGWELVEGMFTASGSEQWVVLGNFTPAGLLTTEYLGGDSSFFSGKLIYYMLEDVCILDMEGNPSETAIHDTATCTGHPITLNAGDAHSNYLWNDGPGLQQKVVDMPGTYWVKSVDLATCSIRTDTFRVAARGTAAPISLGNDTVVCSNIPLTLNAYDLAFDTYHWNTGASGPAITTGTPGTYYVAASSECYFGSDTIVLSAPPSPHAILPEDMVLCAGKPVSLDARQPGMQYSWSTGSDKCCIEINESGTYRLSVLNICNEQATDEITITYSGCSNCLMAPNAFSPNGDGLNDNFNVLLNCLVSRYRLNIFNRWGQLVFSTSKTGAGWDGTIDGNPCDGGTYFYEVEAIPLIKEIGDINKKGDIILIR